MLLKKNTHKYNKKFLISATWHSYLSVISVSFVHMAKKGKKYIDPALAEMVALRIKELRDQYGHTQEFLIDKVGLGINRYAMLERVPTLMSLHKICTFYDITLSEFFMPINLPPKTGKEVERMPKKK